MNFKFPHYLFLLTILIFISCEQPQQPIEIKSSDFHNAVDQLTKIMIRDIFSPPVASRIYVYPNIAAYETLNQDSKAYNSLSNQLNELKGLKSTTDLTNVNLNLASLIAYIDVAKELVFSKDLMLLYRDSLYTLYENKNRKEFITSKNYGIGISNQILKWMHSDHYNETRVMSNYNIYSQDSSRWEPTPPAYTNGIEPHWSKIRPFILDSASQFQPKPHPKFSLEANSIFHSELMEVYNTTNAIRNSSDTSPEVEIAQFWDCNPFVSINKGHYMFAAKKITPGAHWIGICKIACKTSNADFSKTVFAYTKTSLTIADSFISCWDEKYRSNLIRPETLINRYIDTEWAPILQTPPFPEYTSGHSVVSGAASEVLTEIFGNNFHFEDTTEIPYGLPQRNFTSFQAAAQEAAISRLYGGIHYRSAIEAGLNQGHKIGHFTNSKISFIKH
ncbi:vanadium-dependent haloperoxidase [Winogradskyella psychrotolerans]|uniref:vanadium-dependent haloperoxidase n=1 Tax=Winogradskyella psychrotolerans TaxID=1344585 RepID=UPI001C06EC76|nr:vanadium-dependent haloperoxidase [Winogradskyella psychrotolerans]MBU2928536.1 vanadium-dependent haloperoxidase [Winogradskyella psychrotolerans]